MRVAVIGGGIVGVSAAEWLRRDGHAVTLYDPLEPGDPKQTSYGNAGLLAGASVVPVPEPGLIWRAPRMLFDPDGPLFLKWRYLPRLLPWLVPFLRTGTEAEIRRIAAALSNLLSDTVDQHLALAKDTAAARFIQRGEYIYLYPDRAACLADATLPIRRELGHRGEERDRERLLEDDPRLGPAIGYGYAHLDMGWITDPGRYVAALHAFFLKHGGTHRRAAVDDVRSGTEGVTVAAAGQDATYDRAVLAAGAWSGTLARRLGHHPALESERGYHLVLKGVNIRPPFPYMPGKVVMTPMDAGIRCAGLVEFGGLAAGPSAGPVRLLRRQARLLYPDLEWEAEESWLGHRPSTVDSLPMIGESPKAPGIFFAFGAQHIGLTSGPKTGRLIADLIAGRRANIDLAPFRAGRFDR